MLLLTYPDLLWNSTFLDSLFDTQWTSNKEELDKPWRYYNSAARAFQLREFGVQLSNLTDLSRSIDGDQSTEDENSELDQSTEDENSDLGSSTSTIRPNPPMLVNGDEEETDGEEVGGEASSESAYVKVLRPCNSTWSLRDFGDGSDGSSSKRRVSI
ncbi:hypothetical protein GQX73_g1859 [Xylaria multiplex]|uniref:Uncharacterized protein n=1 Tax=Xylaria multiplex TaxID=323545 RepID=A0A7C8IZY7_9PEZI|nr:hypothetical protein GQX73_g1859 [Xylaria multiplex]